MTADDAYALGQWVGERLMRLKVRFEDAALDCRIALESDDDPLADVVLSGAIDGLPTYVRLTERGRVRLLNAMGVQS